MLRALAFLTLALLPLGGCGLSSDHAMVRGFAQRSQKLIDRAGSFLSPEAASQRLSHGTAMGGQLLGKEARRPVRFARETEMLLTAEKDRLPRATRGNARRVTDGLGMELARLRRHADPTRPLHAREGLGNSWATSLRHAADTAGIMLWPHRPLPHPDDPDRQTDLFPDREPPGLLERVFLRIRP